MSKVISSLRSLLKLIVSFKGNSEKRLIVFNYHRIGIVDPKNPFHRLHTVRLSTFKLQVKLLNLIGRFIDLGNADEFERMGPLNFAITFDDVSKSVLQVKEFLEKKNIPYLLAPCIHITENGFGHRDKVYFIEKYLDSAITINAVEQYLKRSLSEIEQKSFSFYGFTKSNEFLNRDIQENLVEPLFELIPQNEKNLFFNERAYLSWDELRLNFKGRPGVSFANHSLNHFSMVHFSPAEVRLDVQKSHEFFKKKMGFEPNIFSVPFGLPSQNLAIDLNFVLREMKYKSVLWVTGSQNRWTSATPNQLLHISRVHAPESIKYTLITMLKVISAPKTTLRNFFIESKFQRSDKVELIVGSDPKPILAFENLMREGRDYASDSVYYDYCFTNNPFKGKRPDYYAGLSNGRIDTLGSNFHQELVVDGENVSASIWSNWRKLPFAHALSSSMTLRKAMKAEDILVAYKSSAQASLAFRSKNWRSIEVYRSVIKVKKNSPQKNTDKIKGALNYPFSMDSLLLKVNEQVFLSVHRSSQYYIWRFDSYPFAQSLYLTYNDGKQVSAFMILLLTERRAQVVDFYVEGGSVLKELFLQAIKICNQAGVRELTFETSNMDWMKYFLDMGSASIEIFKNYYHINNNNRQSLEISKEEWHTKMFHETPTSGDILLRGEKLNKERLKKIISSV